MIGPEGVAQAVVDRLRELVPDKLIDLEDRLALPEGSLPAPRLIQPRDAVELRLEDYPALLVVPQDAVIGARTDVDDDGSESFVCRYTMRVYVWMRGDHAEATDLARKRMTLAVREVLLTYGFLPGELGTIDHTTLIESYSDIAADPSSNSTVAAAYLEASLVTEETVPAPPPYGRVEAMDLMLHPAMMEESL